MASDEKLTLLTAKGKASHKRYVRGEGGKVEVIGYAKGFRFTQRPIILDPRGKWLRSLAGERESYVVMGAPVTAWKEGIEERRRLSSERDGEDATIVTVARQWMPIDVDKFPLDPLSDIDDGEGLALEVIDWLGLKGIHCVWQLTNSHGFKGKVRLRLWVWLDRAYELSDMKDWAKGKGEGVLDLTVYRPAQPIYTASPLFEGVRDPIGKAPRVGYVEGARFKLAKVGTGGTHSNVSDIGSGKKRADPGAAAEDGSVLAHLKKKGYWISRLRPGQHCIKCPWEDEHSTESRDDDTFYFEAHHNGHDRDAFLCHHNSCGERKLLEFLNEVGYSEFAPVPRSEQSEIDATAADSEAAPDWVYVTRRQLFWDARDGELVKPEVFDTIRPGGRKKASLRFIENEANTKVDEMQFVPGAARVFNDGPLRILNTYVDARLQGMSGDATPWEEHIEWLIPGDPERKWLCDWMAWHYQFPGRKVVSAPVLYGCQGNGKTTLFDTLGWCLGERYVSRPTTSQLDGAFNGWCFGKLLVIVEELMAEDAHSIVEKLKPIVTNPIIDIRMMYREPFKAINACAVAACTNHMASIPLGEDDRRFALIATRSHVDDVKHRAAKLRQLHVWLADGGREVVAGWLGKRDLKDFGPMTRAPETRLKQIVQEATATRLSRAIDLAGALSDERFVSSQMLSSYLSKNNCELATQKLGAVAYGRGWLKVGRWQHGGVRVVVWSPLGDKVGAEKLRSLSADRRGLVLERLSGAAVDFEPISE